MPDSESSLLPGPARTPARWTRYLGLILAAALLAAYAQGGPWWILGFCALAPWLWSLGRETSWRGTLGNAWLMTLAFTLAVFSWFGQAIGAYTGIGTPGALLALALLAPLLQPQFIALALVRRWSLRAHGPWLGLIAGAAAWVGSETLVPKLLGDTLGHGLAPALLMRQPADLFGAAGLSFALILVNEALALGWSRRRAGVRALATPVLLALAVPAALAGYGHLRIGELAVHAERTLPEAATLRIGMVQASETDYERRRQEVGAYTVVREVLDAHFELSQAAIEQHGVDALLWSETVYPTPYGHPRSEDGAALDAEILDFVRRRGVALVFGSYDVDAAGEYNAAVFLEPESGLLAYYRKSHPFPLTEHVPAWLDGPLLRRWLPWAGTWQAGNGARVLPLRARDGRELNVAPLICLDDVRPGLALDGARLGAQALIGLSNDAWFSATPDGARLHLQVARFRSIETRLPQLRVTTNGLTAFVDPSGEVLVQTAIGDRAVLAGEVPMVDPPRTLMVRWGDWFGHFALFALALLAAIDGLRRWRLGSASAPADGSTSRFDGRVVLMNPTLRLLLAALRLTAAAGLIALAAQMAWRYGWQVNALAQIQLFLWAVLAPLLLGWAIARSRRAHAECREGVLLIERPGERIEIPLARVAKAHAWHWPLPGPGLTLELASGGRLGHGLAVDDPAGFREMLEQSGARLAVGPRSASMRDQLARLRALTRRPWLDHPFVKFGLFPLVPALPAFRLHQYIAYGGTFGELQTYGATAWLLGLAIWWASWSIGLMLFAAGLRMCSELATVIALRIAPARALPTRRMMEAAARLLFFLGIPGWLFWRMLYG